MHGRDLEGCKRQRSLGVWRRREHMLLLRERRQPGGDQQLRRRLRDSVAVEVLELRGPEAGATFAVVVAAPRQPTAPVA